MNRRGFLARALGMVVAAVVPVAASAKGVHRNDLLRGELGSYTGVRIILGGAQRRATACTPLVFNRVSPCR